MAVVNRLRLAAPSLCRRLPGVEILLGCRRGYGSAAALQYDYESDEEIGGVFRNGLPMEETEGSVVGRGVRWVIMGDPSVKKHLYAERLSKLLEVPHISMGTIVRQELHPRSSLYKQIADSVNQGKLVSDEVIIALLLRRLEEGYNQGETGFILDGIPRTRLQAEILSQITDIDLVVNLKHKDDCSMKNYLGGSPSKEFPRMGFSGMNFTVRSQSTQIKSSDADAGGVWKEKVRLYAEQMKTLEEYYRRQKKLLDFHVGAAPGETWQGLLAALHLQHMSGLNSSHKLTA